MDRFVQHAALLWEAIVPGDKDDFVRRVAVAMAHHHNLGLMAAMSATATTVRRATPRAARGLAAEMTELMAAVDVLAAAAFARGDAAGVGIYECVSTLLRRYAALAVVRGGSDDEPRRIAAGPS